jgi:uncharacterized protein YjiS (DUF1127 family)
MFAPSPPAFLRDAKDGPRPLWNSLVRTVISGLGERLRRRHRLRATYRELVALDERLLADMGWRRDDLRRAFGYPTWDDEPPAHPADDIPAPPAKQRPVVADWPVTKPSAKAA